MEELEKKVDKNTKKNPPIDPYGNYIDMAIGAGIAMGTYINACTIDTFGIGNVAHTYIIEPLAKQLSYFI